ncbi:hypothetical protein NW762_013788 [Fusarium torreyae]|uniref:Uncharacterized protein n=1 Tax=Fusarium torreyae TaxID=1237075 RepID=A0A9W8V774_9HYPO|nr:hypothetical protein NW762_013788 [Fusarium torreyae]
MDAQVQGDEEDDNSSMRILPLYDRLYGVSCKSSVITSKLNRIMPPDTIESANIQPCMWQEDDESEDGEHVTQEYAIMLDFDDEATNWEPVKAAWNCQVHYHRHAAPSCVARITQRRSPVPSLDQKEK